MTRIIDGFGRWLSVTAADSYDRCRHAGLPAGITSAGRTHDEQVALFTARYRVQWTGNGPFGDVKWWRLQRWVRHSAAGDVAKPGTSRHETGNAIDLPNGGPREWMRAWGAEYGWIKDLVKGELWHFEYQPARDAHRHDPPPAPDPEPAPEPAPAPTLIDPEDDMDTLIAIYLERLGRWPDPNGARTYLRAVAIGTMTWAQVDASVAGSGEGKAFAALPAEQRTAKRDASVKGRGWPA